ncbi:hypothetical protein F4805DRAFT_314225 [Annulohypoxylon moriforme]|nr:hypothetical protein F4805DRAFT_314225 [Annulohypoxylon moriforme]
MAPPTKPSASTSTSSKGTNPAPDFTVNMNRIQTQFEASLKAVRSFLPSRSNLHSAGGSFSALSSSSSSGPQPSSTPQSQAALAESRRAAAEAEFAEDRNLDPNTGIGVVPITNNKNGDASGRDRDTARLRGRLLGKRRKDGEGAEKRWVRKEDSSDEEAGRSGLGRSKRNGNGRGKRSRAEMEEGDGAEEREEAVALPNDKVLDGEDADKRVEPVNQTGNTEDDAENPTPKPTVTDVQSSTPTAEGNSKKRRKKKKKSKKSKNKTGEA